MVYLDNAATTFPKPPQVVRAVAETLLLAGANPGRAGHRLSLAAGHVVDKARRALATLFHVRDPANIVFGFNCTDMLCQAIGGVVEPGWEVAVTCWAHNSVLRPLRALEQAGHITLRIAPTLEQAIGKQTRLAVATHAGNLTGVIEPVETLASLCRARGCLLLVDAAQTAGLLPLYPEEWGIDMVAFPGHKGLYGPQGTGGLYIREGLSLRPLRRGGTGTASAEAEQPTDRPEMYESGTLNTPGLAGLAAGVEFVLAHRAEIQASELALTHRLLRGLAERPGVTLYGGPEAHRRVGTVAFNVRGFSSGEAADALNTLGLAVRGGLHCAPLAHQALGTLECGAVRASFGAFNTAQEVDMLLDAVYALEGLRP